MPRRFKRQHLPLTYLLPPPVPGRARAYGLKPRLLRGLPWAYPVRSTPTLRAKPGALALFRCFHSHHQSFASPTIAVMKCREKGRQMTPEYDPRIERVARALCQAAGKDPDAEHQTNEVEAKLGPVATLDYKRIPNRQDYMTEAKKFVAAFDALQE